MKNIEDWAPLFNYHSSDKHKIVKFLVKNGTDHKPKNINKETQVYNTIKDTMCDLSNADILELEMLLLNGAGLNFSPNLMKKLYGSEQKFSSA